MESVKQQDLPESGKREQWERYPRLPQTGSQDLTGNAPQSQCHTRPLLPERKKWNAIRFSEKHEQPRYSFLFIKISI